jgi:hypothetical protein
LISGGSEQHLFLFKFVNKDGVYEPDSVNRLWIAQDGEEIWVHSHAPAISTERPIQKPLIVYALQPGATATPHLHLWQEDSDFVTTIENGKVRQDGWVRFAHQIYIGHEYRFMLYNPSVRSEWESEEAKRDVFLTEDGEAWTFDGDGTESS